MNNETATLTNTHFVTITEIDFNSQFRNYFLCIIFYCFNTKNFKCFAQVFFFVLFSWFRLVFLNMVQTLVAGLRAPFRNSMALSMGFFFLLSLNNNMDMQIPILSAQSFKINKLNRQRSIILINH